MPASPMGEVMLNKLAHYAIGFVVGWLMRRRPAAAIVIAVTFGVYQVVERSAKDDDAYPEIKQFGVGLGFGLATEATDASLLNGSIRGRAADWGRRWAGAISKAISPQKSAEDQLTEDGNGKA